jgi:phage shock protein PspC (stress-responsive transcriptional regulator)
MQFAIKVNNMLIRQNGALFGVCGGIATKTGIDVVVIRFIFLLLWFLYGFGFGLYLILLLAVPDKNNVANYNQPKILGVCFYFSQKYGFDLAILRIFLIFLLVIGLPFTLIVYLILGLTLPKK